MPAARLNRVSLFFCSGGATKSGRAVPSRARMGRTGIPHGGQCTGGCQQCTEGFAGLQEGRMAAGMNLCPKSKLAGENFNQRIILTKIQTAGYNT